MTVQSAKSSSPPPAALRWLLGAGLLTAIAAFAHRAVRHDKIEEPSAVEAEPPARTLAAAPATLASAEERPESPARSSTFSPALSPSGAALSAGRLGLSQADFQAALGATPVTIYTASWCDVCRKTKRFLTVNGLHYREIDVDKTLGGWDKVESLTGKSGVPVVIVDGDISVGLDARSVMRSVARSMERRLGVTGIDFTPS